MIAIRVRVQGCPGEVEIVAAAAAAAGVVQVAVIAMLLEISRSRVVEVVVVVLLARAMKDALRLLRVGLKTDAIRFPWIEEKGGRPAEGIKIEIGLGRALGVGTTAKEIGGRKGGSEEDPRNVATMGWISARFYLL